VAGSFLADISQMDSQSTLLHTSTRKIHRADRWSNETSSPVTIPSRIWRSHLWLGRSAARTANTAVADRTTIRAAFTLIIPFAAQAVPLAGHASGDLYNAVME
jgi:hypothetical protein